MEDLHYQVEEKQQKSLQTPYPEVFLRAPYWAWLISNINSLTLTYEHTSRIVSTDGLEMHPNLSQNSTKKYLDDS